MGINKYYLAETWISIFLFLSFFERVCCEKLLGILEHNDIFKSFIMNLSAEARYYLIEENTKVLNNYLPWGHEEIKLTYQRYRRCSKQGRRSCHRRPKQYQEYQPHHIGLRSWGGQSGSCTQSQSELWCKGKEVWQWTLQ